jgi:hypothetical protein
MRYMSKDNLKQSSFIQYSREKPIPYFYSYYIDCQLQMHQAANTENHTGIADP